MKGIQLVVSIFFFAQVSMAQESTLNCRFLSTRIAGATGYICMLSRTVIDPSVKSYTIVGEHVNGGTDLLVRGVLITDGSVPELTKTLVTQLYEKFPNIMYFEVFHSGLQRIEPGAFNQTENSLNMKNFLSSFNSLSTIEDGAFDGLRNLDWLRIISSRVQNIAPGAFRDLERVIKLDLDYNRIETLHKDLFRTMFLLQTVYISNNLLEVIDGDIFYHNNEIQYIRLDYNKIQAVGRNFLAGMYQFNDLGFYDNFCASGSFKYREASMRGLEPCFLNYDDLQQ